MRLRYSPDEAMKKKDFLIAPHTNLPKDSEFTTEFPPRGDLAEFSPD
jgi:hypothetical protein